MSNNDYYTALKRFVAFLIYHQTRHGRKWGPGTTQTNTLVLNRLIDLLKDLEKTLEAQT